MPVVSAVFVDHMLVVFFAYGLAFFLLGFAILLQSRKGTEFAIGPVIPWLAGFGLLHGLSEWCDMLLTLGQAYWGAPTFKTIAVLGLSLAAASFICLLQFGARLMAAHHRSSASLASTSLAGAVFLVLVAVAYGMSTGLGDPWMRNSNALMRYVFGLPGAALSALAFLNEARSTQMADLGSAAVPRDMRRIAVVFGIYAVLAGAIVPGVSYFPGSVLNHATFLDVVGIPVQVFRAACAIAIAILGTKILSIFDAESRRRLEAARAALAEANEDLETRVQLRTRELEQEIVVRRQTEVDLAAVRDAALESSKMKSEFLANTSHEIRTPMNGIIGMTSLLLDTKLDPEQREYAKTVEASADSLLAIIDDILDFSKIEAGRLSFEIIDFDLRAVVEAVTDLLAGRAQAKGLEIAVAFAEDVPEAVRGDPGRLRQVMMNLVGNAVKFTEEGEVVISVEKEAETDDAVTIRWSVRDTGIGVPVDVARRLFQAFTQGDGSTTRRYGGTGLGLAISKKLVELMGGEIGVKPAPGRGSIFWFTAVLPKQRTKLTEARHPRTLEGLRVLVVDDNDTNRRILCHQLTRWQMRCDSVPSGPTALAALRREALAGAPYDLAIIDMHMPEMDGMALAHATKADPSIAGTVLVMLTSGLERDADQLRAADVAAHLPKPTKQGPLLECLVRVMSGELKGAVARPAGTATDEASGAKEEISPALRPPAVRGSVLVVEDNPTNQRVAQVIIQKLGYQVQLAGNGRLALDLLERQSVDLVFMDCQMPELDGFEATFEIRKHEGTSRHTPIIAMTAHALTGVREKCLAAGMDDYLSKPIKSVEIGAVLDRWLTGKVAASSANAESAPPHAAHIDPSRIAELRELDTPGEPGMLAQLVELFRNDGRRTLESLHGALESGDRAATAEAAHRLRGGADNLGASILADLSTELEEQAMRSTVEQANELLSKIESEYERAVTLLVAEAKLGSARDLDEGRREMNPPAR